MPGSINTRYTWLEEVAAVIGSTLSPSSTGTRIIKTHYLKKGESTLNSNQL